MSRVWSLPLWAHAVALSLILVALSPFMHLTESAWADDEGLYALQVESLHEGTWEYDYYGASFDPEGRWFPIIRAERADGKYFPYIKHPVYVLALFGATEVLGSGIGLYALTMLGLVLAAVAAWLLAAEIEARAARSAFWLVAVSPMIVNAYVMWAHTLSAAVAGFTLWASLRILKSGLSLPRGVGIIAGLAAGVLFRSEGVLFGGAVGLTLVVVLLHRRAVDKAVSVGVLCLFAVTMAVGFERWLIGRITGAGRLAFERPRESVGERTGWEFAEARLRALWRIVFNPSNASVHLEFALLALILVAASGLALRLGGRESSVVGMGVASLGVAAALLMYGDRFAERSTTSASGLFAAWPVALLAFFAMGWRSTGADERVVGAIVLVFATSVFATQYDVGGGGEWGGRFLSPVVVPIAVLAAVGLYRRLRQRPWSQRWLAVVLLVPLGVFPATRGLEVVRSARVIEGRWYGAIGAQSTSLLVVNEPSLWFLPTEAWRLGEKLDWIVDDSGGAGLEILQRLYAEGVDDVTVIQAAGDPTLARSPYPKVTEVTPDDLKSLGLRLFRVDR